MTARRPRDAATTRGARWSGSSRARTRRTRWLGRPTRSGTPQPDPRLADAASHPPRARSSHRLLSAEATDVVDENWHHRDEKKNGQGTRALVQSVSDGIDHLVGDHAGLFTTARHHPHDVEHLEHEDDRG